MHIIDEKGCFHIFKWRINIIDLLVVIFILCLMPVFWFGYKIFTKESPPPLPQINWEQKHNEEAAKIKNFCREHKRASICK